MYAIDVFAGAGGMSLGSALSGIPVAAAVELDCHSARTYAANHPDTNLMRLVALLCHACFEGTTLLEGRS